MVLGPAEPEQRHDQLPEISSGVQDLEGRLGQRGRPDERAVRSELFSSSSRMDAMEIRRPGQGGLRLPQAPALDLQPPQAEDVPEPIWKVVVMPHVQEADVLHRVGSTQEAYLVRRSRDDSGQLPGQRARPSSSARHHGQRVQAIRGWTQVASDDDAMAQHSRTSTSRETDQ